MRSQRIAEIEQYIYANKTVTLDELCEVFQCRKIPSAGILKRSYRIRIL